jgi:hypothetical protein
MTTRAGLAGLFTGLIITAIFYSAQILWPEIFLHVLQPGQIWILAVIAGALMAGGGWSAARWSGSAQRWRCTALGGFAGALAGMFVFCLWGAAAAGSVWWTLPGNGNTASVISLTMKMFLKLFIAGNLLGALGGGLARLGRQSRADVFDKDAPQMAMNVAITALPASIFAAAIAAYVFPHLAVPIGLEGDVVILPLTVSLLLVFLTHLALTLVTIHEARQAEHQSGMDEVKMSAFVGIAAAPVLILLLFLIDANSFFNPLVLIYLLASVLLSLKSLHTLFTLILPGRAALSFPLDGTQKTEAILFGTIAVSRAPRLAALCIGCGLAMVLPLYVTVVSVLINLRSTLANLKASWQLFLQQGLTSIGMAAVAISALILIYMFYFNLGRWFRKWNTRRSK